jgi:hypothetical protein
MSSTDDTAIAAAALSVLLSMQFSANHALIGDDFRPHIVDSEISGNRFKSTFSMRTADIFAVLVRRTVPVI